MQTLSSRLKISLFLIVLLAIWLFFPSTVANLITMIGSQTKQINVSFSGAHLPLLSSASPGSVVGQSTLTAQEIDQILTHAGSPALGLGTVLYERGVAAHINPAFALAIFHHESDYGRSGVAAQTHSLGNIRCTPGWKCVQGYRWYPSWAAGVADFYTVIQQVYLSKGNTTVAQILSIYAPATDDNDVSAYLHSVQTDMAAWHA